MLTKIEWRVETEGKINWVKNEGKLFYFSCCNCRTFFEFAHWTVFCKLFQLFIQRKTHNWVKAKKKRAVKVGTLSISHEKNSFFCSLSFSEKKIDFPPSARREDIWGKSWQLSSSVIFCTALQWKFNLHCNPPLHFFLWKEEEEGIK